jgi:aminomethyltransferase
MSSPTSTEKLGSRGLRRGEYGGAETALVFSDARGEFAALRTGCGLSELGWRRAFLVSGRDRVRWLNGMISNNVRDLAAGHGVYAFVLNPQGHILGDVYLYNRGDDFVLETDAAQAEKLYPHLKRFIIMDQVEFKPAEDMAGLGLAGAKAEQVLRGAGVAFPPLEALGVTEGEWRGTKFPVMRSDDVLSPRYELWAGLEQAPLLWESLLKAGATPVGAEALELARIAAGIPRYGQDIRERDLPQETGQTRALSFTKGCYIGQEIVERIRARGKLHRGFSGFRVEGPLPAPGVKVQAGGKEVGEITSATLLPSREGEFAAALGYVRSEAGAPGSSVEIGPARATVEALPFVLD